MPYGSIAQLKEFSQVTPEIIDLYPVGTQTMEQRFEEFLTAQLNIATDYINRDRDRDFAAEGFVPPGIHSIALRIAANLIDEIIQRREMQRAGRQDTDTVFSPVRIITDGIRQELDLYPKRSELPISSLPRFTRLRGAQEIEDDAALAEAGL